MQHENHDPQKTEALLQVNILRELFEKVYFDKKTGNEKSMPVKAIQSAYLKLKELTLKMVLLSEEDRQMVHESAGEIEECCLMVEISYLRLAKLLGTLETLRDLLACSISEKSGFRVKTLLTLNVLRQLIRDKEEMQKKEDRLEWLKHVQELITFLGFYAAKLELKSNQKKILEELEDKFDLLKGHVGGSALALLCGLIDTFHDLL